MMPSVTPKEHLLSIERSSERHLGRDGFVSLDRNERVSPIPDEIFRAMLASVSVADLISYPDAGPFVARLARGTGLPEECIAELAGSDAGIRRAFMAYLRPGDRVVALNPAYAMYALYTRIFEGVLERVEYDAERRCDIESVLQSIRPGVRIVILAHPDQPTGVAISPDALRRVVERAGAVGALCIVDEAYHPFHPVTVAGWVQDYDHLLVLRSFSKYPGCAGLRLGYALGKPPLIQGLMLVRGGNEVSGVSLALGCYLLDHPEIAEDFRRAVSAGKEILLAAAAKLGLEALPCVTNFQLLRGRAGDDAGAFAVALERRRYFVKADFNHPALANCIRVALNGPDIMTPFAAALTEAVTETRRRVVRPVA